MLTFQHVLVILRDSGLWMRVEVLDSKAKTLSMNGATYLVYYTAAPFVYIANLRPKYADYILQVRLITVLILSRTVILIFRDIIIIIIIIIINEGY